MVRATSQLSGVRGADLTPMTVSAKGSLACVEGALRQVYEIVRPIPVSVKKTLLRKRLHIGQLVFRAVSTEGLQFLLKDCRARACAKTFFFHRHR